MKHDGCLSQGSQLLTKRQRESTSSEGIIKVKREEDNTDAANSPYNKMDTILSPSGRVEAKEGEISNFNIEARKTRAQLKEEHKALVKAKQHKRRQHEN
jgi:hypothetical protein